MSPIVLLLEVGPGIELLADALLLLVPAIRTGIDDDMEDGSASITLELLVEDVMLLRIREIWENGMMKRSCF